MATLDEVKAAIDRLNDTVKGTHGAANLAPLPPGPQGAPGQPARPGLPPAGVLSAGAIGQAVATAFNNSPVLREIAKQVGYLRELAKQVAGASVTGGIVARMNAQSSIKQATMPGLRVISKAGDPVYIFGANRQRRFMENARDLVTAAFTAATDMTKNGSTAIDARELRSRLNMRRIRLGSARQALLQIFRGENTVSPVAAKVMEWMTKGTGIGERLGASGRSALGRWATGGGARTAAVLYGQGTPAYEKAVQLVSRAAAGAAIDFTLLGGTLISAGASLVKFGAYVSGANRSLSAYSGSMSAMYAISDMKDIFRDMASAQRRSGAQGRWLTAETAFKDKWQPIQDSLLNGLQDFATKILGIVTYITNPTTVGMGLGAIAGGMMGGRYGGLIGGALGMMKAQGGVLSTVANVLAMAGMGAYYGKSLGPWGIVGGAVAGGILGYAMRDKDTSPYGAEVTGRPEGAAHRNWYGRFHWQPFGDFNRDWPTWLGGAKTEDLIPEVAGGVGQSGASTIYGGWDVAGKKVQTNFNNVASVVKAISDAVEAVKGLDERLRSTLGGPGGMHAIPVAGFMAGVATHNFGVKDRNFEAQRRIWNTYRELGK